MNSVLLKDSLIKKFKLYSKKRRNAFFNKNTRFFCDKYNKLYFIAPENISKFKEITSIKFILYKPELVKNKYDFKVEGSLNITYSESFKEFSLDLIRIDNEKNKNKGLGSHLLQCVEDIARHFKAERITGIFAPENEELAEKFYRKNGYRLIYDHEYDLYKISKKVPKVEEDNKVKINDFVVYKDYLYKTSKYTGEYDKEWIDSKK